MENLMSSPRMDYENVDINLDDYQLMVPYEEYYDYQYQYQQNLPNQNFQNFQNYQNDEIVPKSNIMLTDNMNLIRHQQNLSISSNQDLSKLVPSASIDSIPQLTSSISNQSMGSFKQSQPNLNSQLTNNVNGISMTPRKTRNKSFSISSVQTPLKPSTSPSKVSKTPYRHSRSHSRNKLNPLITPNSFISPKYDNLSFDHEDFQTPLQSSIQSAPGSITSINTVLSTPLNAPHSANIENYQNRSTKPEFLRSHSASQSLGNSNLPQFNLPYSPNLRRQNTLDSIKIEDQDDNALNQLKRAKSYSHIRDSSINSLSEISTNLNDNVETSSNIQLIQSQFNLKSYPASINLASIANNKLQSSLLPAMSSNQIPLPPSTNHHQQRISNDFYYEDKKKKDLSPAFIPDLPIKINEKAADLADPKKKHACPLCLARFQRPEHVKRHMKSHSSEKPFECDQPNCKKRFNRKDNLKAHLKKIHNKIN